MSIMSPFKNLQTCDTFLLELLILISHVLCIEFYLTSNQTVAEYEFFVINVMWAIISPDPSFPQAKTAMQAYILIWHSYDNQIFGPF